MKDIRSILKTVWGYDAFRPLQEDIIRSVIDGRDTLALLPTGGGKSICYQVPGLALEGLCLVVSPLIALMKDQVAGLQKKDITALALWSGMSRKEVENTLRVAGNSNCRFLYVSPERLQSSLFREFLPSLNIRLIAVDEAHCISQWGYDFRPPYLKIAELRDELPNVPILALTASATPEVQQDICEKLRFRSHEVFRQSFERPNLSYSVFCEDAVIARIPEILKRVEGTGIVYCKSRRRTVEISELLKMHGISADFYHAGLDGETRSAKQDAWINNSIRVIVCTNAFGMGIDKPDVRIVVHAGIPESLENYYQEAGRAGRDGKRSWAVLLFHEDELPALEKLVDERYPPLEFIRHIYGSVCNYLQVPVSDATGRYIDFELNDFCQKFNLPLMSAAYALKALEQDGWMAFTEQVFLPSTVVFTTGRSTLEALEKENPRADELIKILLRSYEGIMDYPASISEKFIAGKLRIVEPEIIGMLQMLHQSGIIEYQPRKNKPQIIFLRERVVAATLPFNILMFERRKEAFMARVKQMKEFTLNRTGCRSKIIAAYFGDEGVKDCGICDNCLEKKKAAIGKSEFDQLHESVFKLLRPGPLPVKELIRKMQSTEENVWKVLNHLQAENRVEVDERGWFKVKI